MPGASIGSRNAGIYIFNEDGTIDQRVLNNSGAAMKNGDFCAVAVSKISDSSAATGTTPARDKNGYVDDLDSTNMKLPKGFTLEAIANGDIGLIRVRGLHTSANVVTGSTTLADGVAVGWDTVNGLSTLAAYASNQGVDSSASMRVGIVTSATAKHVFVLGNL